MNVSYFSLKMCTFIILTRLDRLFLLTLSKIRVLAQLGGQKGDILPYRYDNNNLRMLKGSKYRISCYQCIYNSF